MPTARATLPSSSTVIASTADYKTVEGNIYFPPSAFTADSKALITDSNTHSTCPWKGVASYYNIEDGGKTLRDAAWYYPQPKAGRAADLGIENWVAFYKNKVTVTVE